MSSTRGAFQTRARSPVCDDVRSSAPWDRPRVLNDDLRDVKRAEQPSVTPHRLHRGQRAVPARRLDVPLDAHGTAELSVNSIVDFGASTFFGGSVNCVTQQWPEMNAFQSSL